MQIQKNKTMAIMIALILVSSTAFSIISLPTANAHTPPWTIPTYPYLNAAPDPVGVGQRVFIVMWAYLKMPNSDINNPLRMQDYRLNVTTPDGKTQTLGPFTPDPTETTYTSYTPTQVGIHSVLFWYPDTVYVWNDTAAMRTWTNDTFLGATSKTVNFTVQQDPVPAPTLSYPLPTEYWTRPIEGQNTDWYTISSNWLGSGSPQIGTANVQLDGVAPTSAHVMWTKPIQNGGVAGGNDVGVNGNMFYTGATYNHRFPNPIIMTGILFYREPFGLSGQAGDVVAVDLRTGQEMWRRNDLPTLSFGYNYDADTPNQHGVFYEGILFTNNFGRAFDARTGNPLFNVTDVPPGTAVLGPHGEILRYVIANAGNTSNPYWYLAQWNSSKLWDLAALTPTIASSANASTPNRFDWNVSASWRAGMTGTVNVVNAFLGDILLGINGTISVADPGYTMYGGWGENPNPYTMWAINLNASRGTVGSLIWIKTYTPTPTYTPVIIRSETVDSESRVFTMYMKETMEWYGYNLDTGEKIWGPVANLRDYDTFSGSVNTENTGSHHVAYGTLYVSGYGGLVSAIDIKTGVRKWVYGNGGPGNSTFTGLEAPWGNYPIFIAAIADGKIYLFTNEHSPNTPQYKGSLVRALNATTGQEIWTLTSWGQGGSFMSANGAIADGFWTYLNTYDMQIYTIGKGPSAMTVQAPDTAAPLGASVTIKGTVTDISEGTNQNEQAARFPNGVPAVSDASQSQWMEYVYMQKPRPMDTAGVPIVLSVVDANGNFREIGTATSNDGFFSFNWKPDIEGQYTVYAAFAGSGSYWPSHAVTAFAVDPAAATPTPAPTAAPSNTDTYVVGTGIAIIAAIAIVGGILALMLRKRP